MAGKNFNKEDGSNAFQIWPILVLAAQNKKTMTYGELSGPTGIFWQNLRTPLAVIKHYCDENLDNCHLTVLVVKKGTDEPGDGLDTVDNFDEAKKRVFEMARAPKEGGKDWEIMLENPGLETLQNFAIQLDERNK